MVVSLVPFLSLMTTPSQDASPSTHPAIVNAIVESLASSHDDETFHATHANVTLQTADQSTSIPGTLVLTTRRLLFVPLDMDITTPTRSGGVVIAVPFRAIAVHAIARGPPGIYMQVEGALPAELIASTAPEDDDDDVTSEVRLLTDEVDVVYEEMSAMAALNPDDNSDDSDDDVYEEGDDDARRAAMLDRLDAMLEAPTPAANVDRLLEEDRERFDDA